MFVWAVFVVHVHAVAVVVSCSFPREFWEVLSSVTIMTSCGIPAASVFSSDVGVFVVGTVVASTLLLLAHCFAFGTFVISTFVGTLLLAHSLLALCCLPLLPSILQAWRISNMLISADIVSSEGNQPTLQAKF
jgi:hypothetical protein